VRKERLALRAGMTHVASSGEHVMRHFDFAPLYRSTVGFDRLVQLLDGVAGSDNDGTTYPPYNIERLGDNEYRITMAVAGFGESEINIEVKEQALSVKGEKKPVEKEQQFLHRGIATRAFERRFQLADHVEVKGADLKDGLLHIDLVRNVPERLKPRQITIGNATKQIEAAA
jgi:molecular chaperone IbpA